ncbi:hypothetical protein N7492_005669 [Penicillium capsulatum]|uniref:Telomere length regulation protein conserved domain-containing protein n=1 Tax=Penicillium capsulatum TaxID=69766 RepID=A0A9W9IA86_9EURO|nr:hypothetical protein N7492_005669 [Penicillium capsulatum]KAJ6135234.1 hypothetical protein N7512_000394 [Penicillium capsulatum]
MDGLLTAVKTAKTDSASSLATAESSGIKDTHTKPAIDIGHNLSSDEIIDLLRSQPDSATLSSVLAALDPYNDTRKTNVDIRLPGPATAQILQTLVSTTIPSHWESLGGKKKDAKVQAALLRCISSVAGLGSLVAQLRSLIVSARASVQQTEGSSSHLAIRDLLSVFSALLEPKDFLFRLHSNISELCVNQSQCQVTWRELVSLVAGGKVLSVAAEAFHTIKESEPSSSIAWLGEGSAYTRWLGGNLAQMLLKYGPNEQADWASVTAIAERALSLGHPRIFAYEIYSGLIHDQSFSKPFGLFLDRLRQPVCVAMFRAIFESIQLTYFGVEASVEPDQSPTTPRTIAGTAALCSLVIGDRSLLKIHVTTLLLTNPYLTLFTIGFRRALIATYGDCDEGLKELLVQSLEQFGDKFTISNSNIREQQAHAQIILLAAGRLQRIDPLRIQEIGRSRVYLNSVSNRLAASSNKARFLGMIVGTGISELTDGPEKSMKFDLEMKTQEAQWYLSLPKIHDEVGSFDSIKDIETGRPSWMQAHPPQVEKSDTRPGIKNKKDQKISFVEEIGENENTEEDEDEDLIPYEKPDDDVDDEEDDSTIVQQKKPTAPVYIRDLIIFLRDNENVERHHLAITTAPSLIRRKIGFGSELAEQIEELALIIVGLQNDHDHPHFHEARLQSMIALIVSQPLKMGRWFASIFFNGDLSQVQRSAVLTALGLSAREISGNGEDDAKALGLPALQDTSFPSKRLSPALEAMFVDSKESPIATLTQEMSRTSLQPLAANAADAMTGPNALKVRTFSSRMEVEKKRQQREVQRQKTTAKDLHKVLGEGFFFPLTSQFRIIMIQAASSSVPSYNPFSVAHILTLFLQTLSLVLTTAGPNTVFLPGFTYETLSLLLSLHTNPTAGEPTVTAALLTLFLAILDLNIASGSTGEERLVTEYASQVIELREWASQVFDRTPSGGLNKPATAKPTDPLDQVRTLSAGVMVRLGEITERYQGRLMGVNAGFSY